MQFLLRASRPAQRLGILPGTFNPVTVAHLALARAAQSCCDEILFVLPRVFPHKQYSGASVEERLEMLQSTLDGDPGFSLALADHGLFVDIAAECRQAYGPGIQFTFLCGRDAAERIAGWDYGKPDDFSTMLQDFDILVAGRQGEYEPPPQLSGRIRRLDLPEPFDHVSATEVRERLSLGEPWEHLVPRPIRQKVNRIYRRTGPIGQD